MNQGLEYKGTGAYLPFSTSRLREQGLYDGVSWGSGRYQNVCDVQFIEPKVVPAAVVGVDDVYDDLCAKIVGTEGEITDEAKECCYKLSHAFEDQNIGEFVVEYGGGDKEISLDIKVNDGLGFLVTTEAEENDGTLNFSIIRDGEVLCMGHDTLNDFGRNINKFFLKCKELEALEERRDVDYETVIEDIYLCYIEQHHEVNESSNLRMSERYVSPEIVAAG